MKFNPTNDLTLDALVGRLTIFYLDNFDNHTPSSNLESAFKEKLTLGRKGEKSKGKQVDNEEEVEPDEDLEALLAKRKVKRKARLRGKIPLIFFSCEEVGHILARFPNKEDKDDKRFNKFKN